MKKCIYLLGIILTNIATVFAVEETSQKSIASTALIQTYSQTTPLNFQWNNFALRADSGALVHDLAFSFAMLHEEQVPPMPSYMVNVTGDNVGAYRLLPNGVHFADPATITVPYDDILLPMGYKPQDIKTYYFDEELAQWKELERVGVDTISKTVISLTTHFTDFANAIIKLPEVPEMKTFVPTAMQDLPEVNPLQGIPMIAPPTANNRGTAELTYPIELPAGRNGMQPNIDLHYSSAGGNDILGVGWSFAQPAITIDTRWGVPRYDERWETEAYLLNGEQIVLHDANGEPIPLPHQAGEQGFERRKFGVVQFYPRDTKNQDRIVRHGTSLKDFWWDVTDRNGTQSFYGYDPIDNNINNSAVVRNADNSIVYWALTATIDIYGNYVRYRYFNKSNEVYLLRIEYTGNIKNQTAPTYFVRYQYDNIYSPREDAIINGRLGVLQKKELTLSCFTILHTNIPISNYQLQYEYGQQTLYKKRLIAITKFDQPRSMECGDHITNVQSNEWNAVDDYLETYNISTISGELDDGLGEVISGSKTHFEYQNAFSLNTLFDAGNEVLLQKNFNRTKNMSWSLGGTATVGCGNIPFLTNFSVGGNYSYSRGTGTVSSMMIDWDGDALPDLVYEEGGLIKYCKQNIDGTFSTPVIVQGLSELSREVSNNHSFGVQVDFGANFSYNPIISDNYTDVYFSDVNGDGLPDQVTPSGIKMNYLVNDTPSFTPLGATTVIDINNSRCGSVHRTNQVDARLECSSTWILDTIVNRNQYLVPAGPSFHDAPINIFESPQSERPICSPSNILVSTTDRETAFYDMVNISPENASHYIDTPLPAFTEPTPNVDYGRTYSLNLPTEWLSSNYKVKEQGDSLFVYSLESVCKDSSDMPDIDIVRVWVAPHEGTIRLTNNIHLRQDTTISRRMSRKVDGVKYYIQHNERLQNQDFDANVLDSGYIAADLSDTIQMVYNSIPVQQHDVFFFRLSANNNRRFDDTEWEQTIEYIGSTPEVYNSATDYVCSGNNDFIAPCEGSVTIGYTLETDQNENIIVKVRHNGTLLNANNPITIPWVNYRDVISFETDYVDDEPQWGNVHIHPYVLFNNSSQDGSCSDITETLHYYPDIHVNSSTIISEESSMYRKLFGYLHKGWGQFAYNNKDKDAIIDIASLQNMQDAALQSIRSDSAFIQSQVSSLNTEAIRDSAQQGMMHSSVQSMINSTNDYNPLTHNNKWIPMHADSRTETWIAYGNLGAIGKRLHSTSIQINDDLIQQDSIITDFEYDSAIPLALNNGVPITTVYKKNTSTQHGISAGFGPMNANMSFGSYEIEMDYMDMNGDGFPDFVSSTAIQYSTPWGGHGLYNNTDGSTYRI